MELSVIIVNYNGKKFLNDCFTSIAKHLLEVKYEIIVVDNNSSDGSSDDIKTNFPDVILISSNVNLGFGKGNNLGVQNSMGKYILLLNNDTILLSPLKPVLEYIKQSENVGAAGIKMLNANKEYLISAGRFPGPLNLYRLKNMFNMGAEFKSGVFSKKFYNVDWLGGAFIMMPKIVYDKIGGFDEDYFMYVEDVDLCKKIADTGYKRVFLPDYSYIHFVGHNSTRDHYLISGFEIYISKHKHGLNKILSLMALSINKLVKKLKPFITKKHES